MVEDKTTQPAATEKKTLSAILQTMKLSVPEVGINVSGHMQELQRNFGLLSLCGLGITSGNVWSTLGGAITVAIYNGGPPGVIYEYIAASVFYWIIAASIAELASAIPSSGRAVFSYLIAILYGITDFNAVLNSTYLPPPLTEIYR
ncbi:MAG: hypothetical protein Q9212_001228 [Teloschistes hypoglaucus]